MSKTKYTYAVARIRALEVSLLTNAVIEQLLACKSAEQALQLLVEKGWGDLTAGTLDADEVLNKEEEKMWQTIREVAPDMRSVFAYRNTLAPFSVYAAFCVIVPSAAIT